MRRILFTLAVIASLLVISSTNSNSQSTPIDQVEVAPNLYRLFVNNAVAVIVFDGDEGKIVVDAGYERTAIDLKNAIMRISNNPIAYLINTHIHGDHTGGNIVLGDENVTIIAHKNVKTFLSTEKKQGDKVIPAFPKNGLPSITFTDSLMLDKNGEQIELIHLRGGHTNSDIVVYFPNRKVVALGDLLFANYFPYVDIGNGGNPMQYLKNAEWIINNFPKDVILIGGHGPVYSINQYKEWVLTLQKTMALAKLQKEKGVTLEKMKEDKILKEWESFGSFFITEDRWLETIYPYL
ncbi:MAG: MBL fold metallo-hydrolase [Bacteroidales bacterium]|nr:MBL fold metallo-hydrolase [Bacteroidales bacterium]MDD4384651.1 MBL fold metallo-hydrolase [Bacteroidales bacterium]MDY0197105.1 MBL fold metallo-hydrolase [Tenuifilaceae bacterium]